jgi:DNA invertase Pin-like site-specific DNA recombinase
MMNTSTGSKIHAEHLTRLAIVYLRQSSPGQVKHNTESRRLQYALADRASALGFAHVQTIDCDLGLSATVGSQRPGFQQLLSAVAMGGVGIVFSRELSRLSRTDKDWCHLMEICRLFNTLIGDEEVVYDPKNPDDQLVLGIKGTLSVAEMTVLGLRMQRGKEAKAKRGELFSTIAPGYVRDGMRLVKDPNLRVQEAIALVFEKFLELGSIRQAYCWFLENGIEVPINKSVGGKVVITWRLPAKTFIPYVLRNPVYAGAYAYGRRFVESTVEGGAIKKRQRGPRPAEQAKILIKGTHEGYISWETYARVQAVTAHNGTNFQAEEATLAARDGSGLLTGLLRCARCGHKLHVRYWGRQGTTPRYLCPGDFQSNGRYCIGFGGSRVDQLIGDEVCALLSPQGVRASLTALEKADAEGGQHVKALERQLQQAQYEADRAGAQYDLCDPNNRLVADTLEQRWNEKLAKVTELSRVLEVETHEQHTLTAADRQAILGLGARFGEVWNDPRCDSRLKKRLVRAVIKEIIIDIDAEQQQLKLVVHWHGGAHTQLMLPRPLSAAKAHKTAEEDSALIERLAVRYSDAEIARVLSKQGRKTGKGNRWTQTSVALVRRKSGIKPAPPRDPNLLNLLQAQKYLDVSDSTLLKLIERQVLRATQLAPSAPFEINKADLDSEPVASIIKGLKTTGRLILKGRPLDTQTDLFS